MKGTYLLVLELFWDVSLIVGKKGVIHFQKGGYGYVGSGLNDLEQRVQRHLRAHKKMHWHIDYLLLYAEVVDIFLKETTKREECTVAGELEQRFVGIPGFGCSDCSCHSHLFFGSLDALRKVAGSLHMERYTQDGIGKVSRITSI